MFGLRRRYLVIALVALLALRLVGTHGSRSVQAAMGTRGVPVRCYNPGELLEPGDTHLLACVAADDWPDPFTAVPSGHYLLVTDIFFTPLGGSTASGVTEITIWRVDATAQREFEVRLRATTADSLGKSFGAPYIVLREGDYLEVHVASSGSHDVMPHGSGLLVTNPAYLLLLAR
jgi:hypothetical protein